MPQTTYRQQVILSRALQELQQGKIPEASLESTLFAFGKAGYLPARSAIEQCLNHPSVEVRSTALKVLTHAFHLNEYGETARHFLLDDPDEEIRAAGAQALADLYSQSRDQQTLTLLARVVANVHEVTSVRKAAYMAMHAIIGSDPRELFRLSRRLVDMEKDIDWEMVNTYL